MQQNYYTKYTDIENWLQDFYLYVRKELEKASVFLKIRYKAYIKIDKLNIILYRKHNL